MPFISDTPAWCVRGDPLNLAAADEIIVIVALSDARESNGELNSAFDDGMQNLAQLKMTSMIAMSVSDFKDADHRFINDNFDACIFNDSVWMPKESRLYMPLESVNYTQGTPSDISFEMAMYQLAQWSPERFGSGTMLPSKACVVVGMTPPEQDMGSHVIFTNEDMSMEEVLREVYNSARRE